MDRIRVLIAEDQEILRNNLSAMLCKEPDIELVGAASSGEEAIALDSHLKPEIVLLDVEMENATAGIEAARKILVTRENVKVIFLTVHEDEHTIINAMGTGAVDYVIKSADCEAVIAHIRKAHKDIIEMDAAIQKVLHAEYLRLSHSTKDNLSFIRGFLLCTQTEREIIGYLLKGMKIGDIAAARFVEPVTIKKQVGQILKKSGEKRTKTLCERIRELQIESLFQNT